MKTAGKIIGSRQKQLWDLYRTAVYRKAWSIVEDKTSSSPPTLRATIQNKEYIKVILFQTQSMWSTNYSTLLNMGELLGTLGINAENLLFNSLVWMRPKTVFLHWLVNKVIIFNYKGQSYIKNHHKAKIF